MDARVRYLVLAVALVAIVAVAAILAAAWYRTREVPVTSAVVHSMRS
jgi:hypothetical protein